MKMKTAYLLKNPNYLTFRTAIEAEIIFVVCLSKCGFWSESVKTPPKKSPCSKKIGAVLVQQADRRSFEASAVTILVCFYILCNNKSYKEPSGFLRAEPLSSYFEDRKGYREGKKLLSDKSVFPSLTYHLQSAQFITNARGEQYEHIEYTPYGELWIEETAPGIDKLPFRFTGKELDEETGLYYYGARYLDPKYSRWLSGDPALGEYLSDSSKSTSGGIYNSKNFNFYHYANNNPIKYSDPNGKDSYLVIWASSDEEVGHAAFAVDNYKEVENEDGSISYISDGTVTFYELGPARPIDASSEYNKNVPAKYKKSIIDKNDLLSRTDLSRWEDNEADGIIKFSTDKGTDDKTKKS